MALFGEGVNFPGAGGNFAGMMSSNPFALGPAGNLGAMNPNEVNMPGGFLAGGGWLQPSLTNPSGEREGTEIAGGPSLFPIPKDINKGQVKGKIEGVQGGSRNDLSKPYGGLQGRPQAMGPSIPGFDMGNMAPFQVAGLREDMTDALTRGYIDSIQPKTGKDFRGSFNPSIPSWLLKRA